MELTKNREIIFGALVFVLAALLTVVRLGSYGIWDPSEMNAAEAAARLVSGNDGIAHTALSTWLIAHGFELFGKRDWGGRLPIALSGLLAVGFAYLMARKFAGARTALYTVLAIITAPLFIFNARSMLGDAPAMAAQAAVALCAGAVVLGPWDLSKSSWVAMVGWIIGCALSIWLAILARGALLGAIPPLCAVATFVALRGYLWQTREFAVRTAASWLISAAALFLLIMLAMAATGEVTSYNAWIGSAVVRPKYPEFEKLIESVFHGFAPWSALVPIALAYLFAPASVRGREPTATPTERPDSESANRADHAAQIDISSGEDALGQIAALWIFWGYGAHTLFISLGGETIAFLPIVALGLAVALFLRSIERQNVAYAAAAIVGALLVGLIIRDYALYPSSPLKALPQARVDVPEVFKTKRYWAAILAVFAATYLFALTVPNLRLPLQLRAPYVLLKKQWKRGLAFKIWLSAAALLVMSLVAVSAGTFAAPKLLHLTTIATRVFRGITLAVLLLPAAIALLQLILFGVSRLKGARLLPMLSVGACFGIGVSQVYLPQLSTHLSPRAVFETYGRFAKPSEELIEYRLGTRTASYYLTGNVREIVRQSELLDYLLAQSRRWAILPASELSAVDGEYRKRAGKHLFVVDSRSARAVLVTNQTIGSLADQNSVAKYVLKEPPPIAYSVHARFGEYLELIGYNLTLPHDDYVGAGESFTLTWYFRVLKRVPSGYKIFVHIDGYGLRLNGDHDPVDGAYALNLWEKGDVIVDSQQLHVPGHFRTGKYTIFMGYFSGETRLPVVQGPHDDGDRVIAGTIGVR
jgi:4-amino-4-deoxy-L-arabinose transferase-like glycosyltransferase